MRFAVALLMLGGVASADPEAAKLFDEGRALAKEGKQDEACATFERSWQIEKAIGTQLNVADCKEHSGKLREAWEMFRQAADDADGLHDKTRAQFARNRADALEGKLAVVVIKLVPPIAPHTVVSIDGRIVQAAETIRERTEAGVVTVREASEGRFKEKTVNAAAGDTIGVELESLDVGPSYSRRTNWVIGGTALIVAGAVTIYGGTVWGSNGDTAQQEVASTPCMMSGSKYVCPTPAAAAALQDNIDTANRDHTLATVFEVSGAVIAATGIAALIFAPKDQIVVAPTATSNSVGMAFSARF